MALKTLGRPDGLAAECRVITEVMPTWRDLRRQRLRWHRGALENIGAYGLTRATAIYWFQQLALGYGVIALNAYFLLMLITLLAADSFAFSLFWSVIGLIFVVERVVTVWAVAGVGGCSRHRSSSSWATCWCCRSSSSPRSSRSRPADGRDGTTSRGR